MAATKARGYVCTKTGALIDQETDGDGRWCSGQPACLHIRRGDGYQNGRPAWKEEPTPTLGGRANGSAPASGAVLVHLSSVKPSPVRWLWPGRMPEAKLTILDGDPGLGKSSMALDLGARITIGSPMPDGTVPDHAGFGGVVILSAEDGLEDTIRPRLDAAGADVSRVVALVGVRDPLSEGERLPTLADVDAIRAAIRKVRAQLVIVDPFMAYLPGRVDSSKDQEVRSILARLKALAEETGAAILLIRHLNKAQSSNVLYRGGGSIGIIGAARSGLLVARDPDDTTGARRIVVPTKSNLAAPVPAIAYRLVGAEGGAVRVVWEGETAHTAERLLAEPEPADERTATSDAMLWLHQALSSGERAARNVRSDAHAAEISVKVLRTAKERLAVKARREGYGSGSRVFWSLPLDAHGAHSCPTCLSLENQGIYAPKGIYAAPDTESDGMAPWAR